MHISADQPLITLTTDFGQSDHYVASMKGVILSRCPAACIVDISHQIPAFSILAGAYTIDQAAPFFPSRSIHVVVVDPGVGTSRKALLVEANTMRFVAPDNGVLSLIVDRYPNPAIRELTNNELFLPAVSATFHGRDIFAAVAGALAAGTAESQDVGPLLQQMELLPGLHPHFEQEVCHGIVLSVDHFGNIITNLQSSAFESVASQRFQISINGAIVSSFYRTFGAASSGIAFAYFGSSGYVELGMNQASAAAEWNVKPGTPLTLTLGR
jgi:S-adenosyl-L-methionine hydrolase (adenosine-forming)